MTWGDYMRVVAGRRYREDNRWRHTRSILGALTGTDPRHIYELPGDWSYRPKTKTETEKRLKQLGVDWKLN